MKMMHQFLDIVANRARTDVERFYDFLIRFPIARIRKNLLLARQIDICLSLSIARSVLRLRNWPGRQ